MRPRFEQGYFRRDIRLLKRLDVPAPLLEVLRLHWRGDLARAHAAADRVAPGDLAEPYDELLVAERSLLSVKLGLAPPSRSGDRNLKNGSARLVWLYASFSQHFWMDQRKAWRDLRQMFWSSLRVPCSGMLLTTVFLSGHLAAIAGFRQIGYTLAAAAYWYCCRRPRRVAVFARSIVFAAFPYTVLISGKLGRLDRASRNCQRQLPPDPYYITIFLVSALYGAAYTGDVVRAELLSAHLKELQARGRMHRYQSVARIAPLLPLAFRGYAHLVEQEFEAILAEHRPEESDTIVNSQFYRMAALIAVSGGRFETGLHCIELASEFRKKSAFGVWKKLDRLIRDQALKRIAFDPTRHRLLGFPLRFDSLASLGTLLLDAVRLLPGAYSGGLARFENQIFELLRRHLDCPAAEVRDSPGQLLESELQLRVGSRYLVFHGIDEQRVPAVQRLLSSIAPVFSILVNGAREMLAAKSENERISREAAMARVTQMLAHDVRQPFTILASGIDSIRRAKDPADIQRVAELLVPELDEARSTVDGLIADVLEFGSNTPPHLEPTSPEALVDDAVRELVRARAVMHVGLDYSFSHTRCVLVDTRKVRRVFSNILTNALQAIGDQGRIWFRVQDVLQEERQRVEFVIGNSGPAIPAEDAPKIFEAFFTKGNSEGTGLGLAIARRVVLAHGGQIGYFAIGGPDGEPAGVEFRFTLPAAEGAHVPQTPHFASARTQHVGGLPNAAHAGGPRAQGAEHALAQGELWPSCPAEPGPGLPELALVDDSRVFLAEWQTTLRGRAVLRFFPSPEAFWKTIAREPGLLERLRAVITDYRFSNSGETGASFASALRERASQLPVILSSSSVFSERESAGSFDGILSKTAISWDNLTAAVGPLEAPSAREHDAGRTSKRGIGLRDVGRI